MTDSNTEMQNMHREIDLELKVERLEQTIKNLKDSSNVIVEQYDKQLKKSKERIEELEHALDGPTDLLHNHYGDDPDETPFIDAAFAALRDDKE